jgi:hypothetical protein
VRGPLDLEHLSPEVAAAREQLHPDQPQRVIAQAASLLSSLSSFVGVVTAPRKASVFHHIEFLRLGERRVLVILVAPDGDVQNRVIFTARDYQQAELIEASNYLNAHYAGLTHRRSARPPEGRDRRPAHGDRRADAGRRAGRHRSAGREHRQRRRLGRTQPAPCRTWATT